MDDAETELKKPEPNAGRLNSIGAALWDAFKVILKYCGGKADKMLDKSAEVIGETGTKWAIGITAASIASQQPQVQSLSKGLIEFARKYLESVG